jgi:hypothetical protein
MVEPCQLGRPVRRGKHVPGHQDQPGRVVAQHPPAEERDDVAGDSGRDGLRLQVGPPELGDAGPEFSRVRRALPIPGPFPGLPIPGPFRGLPFPDAESREHRAQFLRPRTGQRGRAGAHQRERRDLGVGPGQDGLAADQPAVGVPD